MVKDPRQNANSVFTGRQQFLQEVFPTEHREITRRRQTALGGLRQRFMEVVEAAAEAEDKLREAEQKAEESKKEKSFLVRWIPQSVVKAAVKAEDKLRKAEQKIEESKEKKQKGPLFARCVPQKLKEEVRDIAKLHDDFENKKTLQAEQAGPSTRHSLVGLAFSGGGIRSATFNLGVMQALAKYGILKHVDYLSTVSGGGYIGSCLSSLLNRNTAGIDWQHFSFYHEIGKEEPDAVKHLRNSGNYLTSGGLLDVLRIPALLLRGIVINFLVILPYLVLAVWLTNWWYGERLKESARASTFLWAKFYDFTPWVVALFLIWIVLFPVIHFLQGKLVKWQSRFQSFQVKLAQLLDKVTGWELRNAYELSFAAGLLGLAIVVLAESLPAALFYYDRYWLEGTWGEITTWLTLLGSLIPFVTAGKAAERVSRLSGKIILYGLGLLGPLILLLISLRLGAWVILDKAPAWLSTLGVSFLYVEAVGVFIYTRLFVDVNSTSLHSFYRDRLSKAYLFQVDPNSRVQANDKQKLSALNVDNTKGPYHLINVALNLQGSEDPNLRGRNSDFFIFSKCYSGSQRTGYYPTDRLEKADPHLDLGTAMAISGAAAAPNMGTTTIKPLVFIMTLLNNRLVYSLPNPYILLTKPWYKRGTLLGVGPFYLLVELFSRIHERSRYVNLSDGGHIENLAIYELLRRRCKFIIVGDGEADPELTFHGLATLIRFARIDMGIEIDIELDDVRKPKDGLSRKHCALGKIYYHDGETGYLLYIKSSVTGDENEYIREYRSRHPEFPHESTADQFFDEAQFEAYRALGYHIVNELFQERQNVDDAWFENLETSLRPRFQMEKEFIELQKQLSAIERQFRDPEVAEYTYQIYPELRDTRSSTGKTATETTPLAATSPQLIPVTPSESSADSDERFRKIFHLCNLQMQLMENVYIALQLDKSKNRNHYFNRGWMNLFRRWAQARDFRRSWAVSIGTYSVGFQTFCEEALKLHSTIQWRLGEEKELTPRERYHLRLQREAKRFGSGEVETLDQRVIQDQIWIAEMVVMLTPGTAGFGSEFEDGTREKEIFPIGFVTVRLSRAGSEKTVWENADLMYYRIQDYYRQMRLLEKMIPVLRETLKKNFNGLSKFRVNLTHDPEVRRQYSHFFERNGLEVVG